MINLKLVTKKAIYKIFNLDKKDEVIQHNSNWRSLSLEDMKGYKILPRLRENKNYYDLDVEAKDTKSPLNPWAFIRVKNEAKTLQASLDSISQSLQRGVIAYHECTDGSDLIIKDFVSKHKGFKAIAYPYKIESMQDYKREDYQTFKDKNIKELYEYYNFTLSFIPKQEWLIKIDCDQIYDPKKLFESFYVAKKYGEQSIVFYSRLNIYIIDNKPFLEKDSLIDVCDHWLIRNEGLSFGVYNHEGGNKMEILQMPPNLIAFQVPNHSLHFPYVKTSRQSGNEELDKDRLLSIKEYIHFRDKNKIDLEVLNEHFVDKCIKSFNL